MRVISQEYRGQDLGSLWREAESLGRVEVDQEGYRRPSVYKVQIKFERRGSGTTIWAAGISPIIEQAISKAIEEARELGAVPNGGPKT
jgi:hypothetical protein